MDTRASIQPGATLGIFGGGQLGRMFVTAASRLGYRVIVFCPSANDPAARLADDVVVAPYDDHEAVRDFASRCDVITLEFENVPDDAVECAQKLAPVRPGVDVLRIAQDRIRERAFLDRHGFPVSPYRHVPSATALEDAVRALNTDVVVKTARLGYDGRGQVRLGDAAAASSAWDQLSTDSALCESVVDFQCELSMLVARSPAGRIEVFGPIENHHAHHILDLSVVPAEVTPQIGQTATDLARDIALALDLEGLICVEMFVTTDGSILVNELAPRPHNSGHLTIEACRTSQFEQQVRAICNLPLADMELRTPAAMVNLLGDLWAHHTPAWSHVLRDSTIALHLYGKDVPRARRKMGHMTAIASSVGDARRRVLDARERLANTGEEADDYEQVVIHA
ncbi:MAG: 5-(carboxyamino)imidazole ribonucleotide synthase [Planctomycetota bacterium]